MRTFSPTPADVEAWAQVNAVAVQIGFQAVMEQRPNGTFSVTIERPDTHSDWSMKPTVVAVAQSTMEASRRAIDAMKKLAPQIARKVAEGTPDEEPDEPVTVRLHPDDIAAIGEAVARFLRAPTIGQASGIGDAVPQWVYFRIAYAPNGRVSLWHAGTADGRCACGVNSRGRGRQLIETSVERPQDGKFCWVHRE